MRKTKAKGREGSKTGGLRRQLVEKEILDRAAELFAERGVAGTTLKDLADALGMSRPALYYYFSSKEAVLERLVESLSGRDARALGAIRRRPDETPTEKLRAMARELAGNAGASPQQARILSENRHQLSENLAEAARRAEHSIVRDLVAVVEAGTASGEFRRVDARTAAMGIVGMCIWAAWWVDPDTASADLEVLVDDLAQQALGSLQAAVPSDAGSAPSAELLQRIRKQLAELDAAIVAESADLLDGNVE